MSNLVLAPRQNGGIWVTVDMRKPIKDTNIPIIRVKVIRTQLNNYAVISKLDFKSESQLKLGPGLRHLTKFHARHQYKCTKPKSRELSQGLKPLFTATLQPHVIHNNLIIAGIPGKKHNSPRLCFKHNWQVRTSIKSWKKYFFCAASYIVGIITISYGIKPNPHKVQALTTATKPTSREGFLLFLKYDSTSLHIHTRTEHQNQTNEKSYK